MQQSAQMGEIEAGARPPRTEPAAAFVTFIVVSGVRLLTERPLRSAVSVIQSGFQGTGSAVHRNGFFLSVPNHTVGPPGPRVLTDRTHTGG